MRYCRFLLDGQTHYGKVEERGGELWIEDLIEAPEEDLAFRLEHGRSTALRGTEVALKPSKSASTDPLDVVGAKAPLLPRSDVHCGAPENRRLFDTG